MPHALRQADQLQHLDRPLVPHAGFDAGNSQRQLHVLIRRQHRQQGKRLKHKPNLVAPQLGQGAIGELVRVLALDRGRATGRPVEATEQIEERRLPRPGAPPQGDELAGHNVEGDIADGHDFLTAQAIYPTHALTGNNRRLRRRSVRFSAKRLCKADNTHH